MLDTNKVVIVSNNVAFGLVDSGRASFELFTYPDKMLQPEKGKRYKTK